VTRVSDEHDAAGDADLDDADLDDADLRDTDLDDEEPDVSPWSHPVETARRRHGTAGAVLAAGMLGIDIVLGRKPKEEVPVVVDAPTEPTDIDTDGIRVDVDEATSVIAPPQPRSDPLAHTTRRRRRASRPR